MWQFLPPLVPSYPRPLEAIWVRSLRLTLQPNSTKNCIWNDLSPRFVFAQIWEPIWMDFWTQNQQKMHPEWRPPSNCVLQWMLACKTTSCNASENIRICKNNRTVVQKSTLHLHEVMLKYPHVLHRVWCQNPSNLEPKSYEKWCIKRLPYFITLSITKIYQNVVKRVPKMLYRNWENRPGDHFGHIKLGSWSQRQVQGPSRRSFWPHMEANGRQLRPLGTHCRLLHVVLTVLRGQFLLAKP